MRPLIKGILPTKELVPGVRLQGVARAKMMISLIETPMPAQICYYIWALRPGKKRIEFYMMPPWNRVHTTEAAATFYFPKVEAALDCRILRPSVQVLWEGRLVDVDCKQRFDFDIRKGDALNLTYKMELYNV